MDCPVPAIRCRQIGEADIAAVASLLRRGFPNRTRQFWFNALQRLARREPPPGFPQYGYLLESGDAAVGAILMICSTMPDGEQLHCFGGPKGNHNWAADALEFFALIR